MDVSQHNVVSKLSEICDGEMKEVKVGETPVLPLAFALLACVNFGLSF